MASMQTDWSETGRAISSATMIMRSHQFYYVWFTMETLYIVCNYEADHFPISRSSICGKIRSWRVVICLKASTIYRSSKVIGWHIMLLWHYTTHNFIEWTTILYQVPKMEWILQIMASLSLYLSLILPFPLSPLPKFSVSLILVGLLFCVFVRSLVRAVRCGLYDFLQ